MKKSLKKKHNLGEARLGVCISNHERSGISLGTPGRRRGKPDRGARYVPQKINSAKALSEKGRGGGVLRRRNEGRGEKKGGGNNHGPHGTGGTSKKTKRNPEKHSLDRAVHEFVQKDIGWKKGKKKTREAVNQGVFGRK